MSKTKTLASLVVAGYVLSGCSVTDPPSASTSSAAAATTADICSEWNTMVGKAYDPNSPGDLRASLAGQMADIATRASGTLKEDIQYLSETGNLESNDEIAAADARIGTTCATQAYLAKLHPETAVPSTPATTAASPKPPHKPEAELVGVQNLSLTMRGGFIANVKLKWHAYQEVDQTQFGCEAASFGTNVLTKATVVEGTVDYPITNGIAPPPAFQATFVAGDVKPFEGELLCSSVRSADTMVYLPTAASVAQGSAEFFLVVGEVSNRTPDNPQGTFSDFHLKTKLRASGVQNCSMEGPGTSVQDCTISMPR